MLQPFGTGGVDIDLAFGKDEVEEFLLKAGGAENRVDTLEQGALLAVVQRTVNARKCWTKGGLVGEGGLFCPPKPCPTRACGVWDRLYLTLM